MTSTTAATASSSSRTGAVDEAIFLSQIESLKSFSVVFSDTYQAPPDKLPSKISAFGLEVLPPPERKVAGASANLTEVLNVTFKSLKPAYSVTLPIGPADSILTLKGLLSSQQSSPFSGSTPAQQRLLLKGKALLDSKLVKDYEIKDESVVTVMMSAPKPATTEATATTTTGPTVGSSNTMDLSLADRDPVPPAGSPSLGATAPPGHKRRVSDIPAVTLSPAGTPGATTPLLQPIPLSTEPLTHLPLNAPPSGAGGGTSSSKPGSIDLSAMPILINTSQDDSPYHQTMSNPQFWKELRSFLEQKFGKEVGGRTGDGDLAFEEFLRSAKASLSPHEIAKIRDEVGITGMGGH
ncbi:hypothetical protein FS842_004816 [Serendipita sp. 407]|nr:hypothetical protein FS842_004816 [Serendipita sp. 407]